MKALIPIREFIVTRDRRQLTYYFAGIIGGLILLLAFIVYWFYSSVNQLDERMHRVNKARELTKSILQKHEIVLQQQKEVEAILSKDKGFRIGEYFASVLRDLGLAQHATKPAEVSEPQDVTADYAEIKLDASFSDINMKQLIELLYKIEQNERIYTKEIVITKAKNRTLDVTLVIATLQPKATTT